MSKLDKLRKAQARVAGQEPAKNPTSEFAPHVEAENSQAQPPPAKNVRYLCGHETSNQLCGSCRAEKRKKNAEVRLAKRQAKPRRLEDKGRLPHGSYFSDLKWDAQASLWSGAIHIMNDGGVEVFCTWGVESALFQLLRSLDQKYRELLQERSRERGDTHAEDGQAAQLGGADTRPEPEVRPGA